MRRRLYLQIYLGVIGVALVITLLVGFAVWHLAAFGPHGPRFLEVASEEIAKKIDGVDGAHDDWLRELREEALLRGVHATLFDAAGELLGSTRGGRPRDGSRHGVLRGHAGRMPRVAGITVELEDGRWLHVHPRRDGRRGPGPFFALTFLLIVIGAGAYPVSRRITRRLERLQQGVERLGEGQLTSRVQVEGNDEVADLARSFNSAAERIESLVETQKRLLASASHELRTPLARLRVAIELLAQDPRESLRAEAERDIIELDELIDDLLLAARLESGRSRRREPVDLAALVREEAEHFDAHVDADEVSVHGDANALRRMLRNLLENASRYGAPPIEIELREDAEGGARLRVNDGGPGVPENEREAIFEAFYRQDDHSEGRHGGVGLGLALVREIARHHGGDARCVAAETEGSVFEVRLGGDPAS